MPDFDALRREMVESHLAGRGIQDEAVLEAMRVVPREQFVPQGLAEFAYVDAPLPIGEEQTISQPFIVAHMIEALDLDEDDHVLDVGTGSGYAAAVLSRVVESVYTVERHRTLLEQAEDRFRRLAYDNIHTRHGDGSQGWREYAPYDGIVAAAAGPKVPGPLLEQMTVGGRLVLPVGAVSRMQKLLRVHRRAEDEYDEESLGLVQFVPLVREDSSAGDGGSQDRSIPELISEDAEPFSSIDDADLDGLLQRIGDARVVLLGEATHGTAEFYDMRARITAALIEEAGFNIVAVEADWPDAAQVDNYIRKAPLDISPHEPFTRFPTWMWANSQVLEFVEWLRDHNQRVEAPENEVTFNGLDLYGLHRSIESILHYLDDVDPEAAQVARQRYGCLTPWEHDPASYGAAAASGRYRECEGEVVAMLQDLLGDQWRNVGQDGQRFVHAVQNARLVASAERYYRTMYRGSRESWNLRDQHMFDTLEMLLGHHGPDARAVVWAHNSHLGDASATEMGARGEHNVGQLCRERFGDDAYLVGFGTDRGTVAAASQWGGEVEVKQVRPAHEESYERLCRDAEPSSFLLPLRNASTRLRQALIPQRLERAIGVVYRPRTELQSHYFQASLPRQFDEYIWFDETHAVSPLQEGMEAGMPETFPFGV